MWNSNVNYAQSYVNERVALLSEHVEVPHVRQQQHKVHRLWKAFLSLWL